MGKKNVKKWGWTDYIIELSSEKWHFYKCFDYQDSIYQFIKASLTGAAHPLVAPIPAVVPPIAHPVPGHAAPVVARVLRHRARAHVQPPPGGGAKEYLLLFV